MKRLVNVTCSDNYKDAATLSNIIGSSGGYFNITGNDVWMEIQYGLQGQVVFTDEVHIPIGGGILAPFTTGIRFRNFVAGQNAVVSAGISEKAEPPIQIAASGQALPSGSSVIEFVGANFPAPGSHSDGDVIAFQPDNLNNPAVLWLLRYNATDTFWYCIGGNSLTAVIAGAASTTVANTFQKVAGGLLVSRPGTYMCRARGNIINNGAGTNEGFFTMGNDAGGLPTGRYSDTVMNFNGAKVPNISDGIVTFVANDHCSPYIQTTLIASCSWSQMEVEIFPQNIQ